MSWNGIPWTGPWTAIDVGVNALFLVLAALDAWLHPEEKLASTQFMADPQAQAAPPLNPLDPDRSIEWLQWGADLVRSRAARLDLTRVPRLGRFFVSVLANVLLGGPRQLRVAAVALARLRRRQRRVTQLAALRLLHWLEARGSATEAELAAWVAGSPSRAAGLRLARDLSLVIEEQTPEGSAYRPVTARA